MNVADEIEKLIKLRYRGVLTREEFQELKAYTLGTEPAPPVNQNEIDKPVAIKEANQNIPTQDPIKEKQQPAVKISLDPETTKIEEKAQTEDQKIQAQPVEESRVPANVDNYQRETKLDTTPLASEANQPKTDALNKNLVIAVLAVVAAVACIGLGVLLAQKTDNNSTKTDTEAKLEAEQKQAASDEAFEKMLAENKKGA